MQHTTSSGTGKANPLAAIRSASLMLDHLGEGSAAERIDKAVSSYLAEQTRRFPVPINRRRRRRHRRKGLAVPITPSESIWFDGELVPWEEANDPRTQPLASLRIGRIRGDSRISDVARASRCSA